MLVRVLRTYLQPYRRLIAVIVGLQLVSSMATLYLPTLNAEIIDNGVVRGDTRYILGAGGVMLAVTVVQVACSAGAVYFGSRTAMSFGRDLRSAIFLRVQRFSAREVGHFGTPSLITRTTNDVQQVQMLALMTFTLMVTAPIIGIGSIFLALNQSVPLSLLLVIVIPVLAAIVVLLISRMRPLFRLMQTHRPDQPGAARADHRCAGDPGVRPRPVRAEPVRRRERGPVHVALGVGRLLAFMFPSVLLVIQLTSVATLWFGGHLISDGHMQIGALTAFLSYLVQVLGAVLMATFLFVLVPRAEACAERIEEVLDTETSVEVSPNPVTIADPKGRVRLSGVEFRYPGAEEAVLHGVDLVAGPGEVTAVIGSTGSGKTTLLSLVARLFDATRVRSRSTRRRPRLSTRTGLRTHRPHPAAALSLLRHRCVEPPLRQARRDR